jgi:hypothetical protein
MIMIIIIITGIVNLASLVVQEHVPRDPIVEAHLHLTDGCKRITSNSGINIEHITIITSKESQEPRVPVNCDRHSSVSNYMVLPALNEGFVKTCVFRYVIDVNTSHTPDEGAHSPSWPNELIVIIIKRLYNPSATHARIPS